MAFIWISKEYAIIFILILAPQIFAFALDLGMYMPSIPTISEFQFGVIGP